MALNSQNAYPSIQTPNTSKDTFSEVPFNIVSSATTTDAGYAAQNDIFEVAKLPPKYTVAGVQLGVSATLGASCTVQAGIADDDGLGSNFVALTSATTAAAAGLVVMNQPIPDTTNVRRILALKVAGAAIGAVAKIRGRFVITYGPDVGYV